MTRLALPLALLLALAACGDSTSAVDSAAPSPTVDGTATAPATTLFDVARAAGLSSFVLAATQAGLEEELAGPGPLTVFAPNDAAFAALPPGTLDALLLPENQEALRTILAYHLLPQAVRSDQIERDVLVETLSGEALTLEASGGRVTLTDALGSTTSVVTADQAADNGILHVVGAVLLPAAPDDLLIPATGGL